MQVARNNRANQDAIAAMGGIRPLVELLQPSAGGGGGGSTAAHHVQAAKEQLMRVQANAALALNSICRANTANQTAVSEYGGLPKLGMLLKAPPRLEGRCVHVFGDVAGMP